MQLWPAGERQGLGALCAFQGVRLHFAKDVLEAAQVRHQYQRFENLQELFHCSHSVNLSVFCSSSCV